MFVYVCVEVCVWSGLYNDGDATKKNPFWLFMTSTVEECVKRTPHGFVMNWFS